MRERSLGATARRKNRFSRPYASSEPYRSYLEKIFNQDEHFLKAQCPTLKLIEVSVSAHSTARFVKDPNGSYGIDGGTWVALHARQMRQTGNPCVLLQAIAGAIKLLRLRSCRRFAGISTSARRPTHCTGSHHGDGKMHRCQSSLCARTKLETPASLRLKEGWTLRPAAGILHSTSCIEDPRWNERHRRTLRRH